MSACYPVVNELLALLATHLLRVLSCCQLIYYGSCLCLILNSASVGQELPSGGLKVNPPKVMFSSVKNKFPFLLSEQDCALLCAEENNSQSTVKKPKYFLGPQLLMNLNPT